MRFPDSQTKEQIGFSFVLSHVDTVTQMGKEHKENIKPFGISGKARLLHEYKAMDAVMAQIASDANYSDAVVHQLSKLKDIRNTFKKIRKDGILDEVEFFEVKYFAQTMNELKSLYDGRSVCVPDILFHDLSEVFTLLDPENSGIMTFYFYEAYSEALKEIRQEKQALESKIMANQDGDRREALLLERRAIVEQEEAEEYQIRKRLSSQMKMHIEDCEANLAAAGRLDFLLAKCRMALHFGCSRPEINEGGSVLIEDACHPQIQSLLRKKSKDFVPISLSMKNGVTLLTGANMGGKSVTIKTVTLNIYLSQIGFYTFAKTVSVPVFDFVYYVSDDMQSIERGLSTFGAEIINLNEIIRYVKATKGFVALDELARGTNPKEGRSIVCGLVEYLRDKETIAFISTHYDGISIEGVKHYQVIGLKNVDFKSLQYRIDLNAKQSVDILQQYMDYRLEEVDSVQVPKDALNIATLLGLPKDLISCIQQWYDV